ncbi:hypothetical protein GCM10027093_75150 [Paraburkholderia jirisanensis]
MPYHVNDAHDDVDIIRMSDLGQRIVVREQQGGRTTAYECNFVGEFGTQRSGDGADHRDMIFICHI